MPLAAFLSHGVGSVILDEDADWVDEITDDLRNTIDLLIGVAGNSTKK